MGWRHFGYHTCWIYDQIQSTNAKDTTFGHELSVYSLIMRRNSSHHHHHFRATGEGMVWKKAVLSRAFCISRVTSMPQSQHLSRSLWIPLPLLPDNSCNMHVPGRQQPGGIWFCSSNPCRILGFNFLSDLLMP